MPKGFVRNELEKEVSNKVSHKNPGETQTGLAYSWIPKAVATIGRRPLPEAHA